MVSNALISELINVLLDIAQNLNKYQKMRVKEKEYHQEYRKQQQMTDGLWEAINYLLKK